LNKVLSIQQSITEIDPNKIYSVPILTGAPGVLVGLRELRGMYCKKQHTSTEDSSSPSAAGGKGYHTNREIKIWSFYFLLKAITTAPSIRNWRKQRSMLLTWCQMNERSFYRYLNYLVEKNLATVDHDYNIKLVGYQQAAHILEINFSGTYSIQYNPYKYAGKQIFQHFIRAEEIEQNKKDQLTGMMNNLDKNPALKVDIILLLVRYGAEEKRLKNDSVYFQQRLLNLQLHLFKSGSDVLSYVFTRRADINRSVKKISDDHAYRSASSVSYMKRIMAKHGVITIEKIKVVSQARSRLYVPNDEGGQRDGYKWFKDQKQTALLLTDQLTVKYETSKKSQPQAVQKKAA
jgi:hypothetical protein